MMFNLNRKSRTAMLIVALIITFTGSIAAQQPRPAQQSPKDAATAFRNARDFITDGEWAKAQEMFSQYVSKYPNEKNIDAALYWLAYSQHKLGWNDRCRATIDRLLQNYPQTSWKDDARVLLAQLGMYVVATVDQPGVTAVTPMALPAAPPALNTYVYTPEPAEAVAIAQTTLENVSAALVALDTNLASGSDDDPCEFKIVVLQALFQTDLQRGIVAATDWLKPGSNQTARCKSAALTLLGRSGGKAATPVILGFAKNEPDLKLRARAISALGSTDDDSVIDPLRDFALNGQQTDIIEAAVYALSRHTGERAINVLSEIATSGKVFAHRKLAIASIASRAGEPAVDALFRIYDADQSVEIRKAVISGFANRKSERVGARLFDIARSSENVELRRAAVSSISRRGGDKAIEFLLSLYDSEKSEDVKDQIINSLGSGANFYFDGASGLETGQHAFATSRMNDQRVIRKLIEIARNPQAPMERRKRAIGWLSRSKDPEVLKFLEELLK
ncbi:MAG TPA: HEAT repeat domain-containing protein [Pyrinomonadaceae bacterium]|nr:HEAT repeat domain-containing protein [Pyrinomonadaceae bacterium]